MEIITILLIGAFAGWLAGQIVKGYGFGIIGNILVGIAGAFIGNYLLAWTGFTFGGGSLGTFFTATLGAVILLWVIGLIKR